MEEAEVPLSSPIIDSSYASVESDLESLFSIDEIFINSEFCEMNHQWDISPHPGSSLSETLDSNDRLQSNTQEFERQKRERPNISLKYKKRILIYYNYPDHIEVEVETYEPDTEKTSSARRKFPFLVLSLQGRVLLKGKSEKICGGFPILFVTPKNSNIFRFKDEDDRLCHLYNLCEIASFGMEVVSLYIGESIKRNTKRYREDVMQMDLATKLFRQQMFYAEI